jgi:voltage-gated potassium channel
MSPIKNSLRFKIHEIIFEADTPAGKLFDIVLLWAIIISIVAVMLESVSSFEDRFGFALNVIEWVLTALFTIEYVARLYAVTKPMKYVTSFYGVVDLLSILPTYLSLVFLNSHFLAVIRGLRLLRVFRILKLARYVGEAEMLATALKASRYKISVFMGSVLTLVMIMGTIMYLIEGGTEDTRFTSIPMSIYWAIVTITTVGFGDIVPQTVLGQSIASLLMLLGYAIIAVPTGIVTVELTKQKDKITTQSCPSCSLQGHDSDAIFCKYCAGELNPRN